MTPTLPCDLKPDEFARLMRPFGVGTDSVQLIGISQNFVYRAVRQGSPVIVRVSTQRYRTRNEIDGELNWILHLAELGQPVCPPLRSQDGALCEVVEIRGQIFYATLFARAPGRALERADLTEALCANVGRLIGRLHHAAREATAKNIHPQRGQWSSSRLLVEDFATTSAPLSEQFVNSVSTLISKIGRRTASPADFGLLHGDVNMGNLHAEPDGSLWIFDFDNCEYGFFLQDLTIFLYDSIYSKIVNQVPSNELTATVGRFWSALLSGYREIEDVLPFDREDIFRFFLLREAVLYVHYHRILSRETLADPFILEMGKHVETGAHPLAIRKLAS